MISGIQVDLTILDTTENEYYQVPVVPPSIDYTDGSAQPDNVKILHLGDVDFPNGVALDAIGWASFFPARYDDGYCSATDIMAPVDYRNLFSAWKNDGTILQVICPAVDLNKSMRLIDFSWQLQGFEGDIYYRCNFREAKTIAPRKVSVGGKLPGKNNKTPAERAPAPKPKKAKTYTVKSGDTLVAIAKANGVADWRTLYSKNKSVIGPNPYKLYIGQVLTL